jgi:hypothetical protein
MHRRGHRRRLRLAGACRNSPRDTSSGSPAPTLLRTWRLHCGGRELLLRDISSVVRASGPPIGRGFASGASPLADTIKRSKAHRMSALVRVATRDVRFTPKSGHVRCNYGCPLWAKSGHWMTVLECPLLGQERTLAAIPARPYACLREISPLDPACREHTVRTTR